MATAPLVWDEVGKRLYETGTDRGVLYPQGIDGTYTGGVAWNGLNGVKDSPDGADPKPIYANNGTYLNMRGKEKSKGTITAYTYPKEFNPCLGLATIAPGVYGGQQTHKAFGLSWRTIIGNDIDYDDHGYMIHIRYGCTVSPSEKDYKTEGDDVEAVNFSWAYEATPVALAGFKPMASIDISSLDVDPGKIKALEEILYGSSTAAARLPLPSELATLMKGE